MDKQTIKGHVLVCTERIINNSSGTSKFYEYLVDFGFGPTVESGGKPLDTKVYEWTYGAKSMYDREGKMKPIIDDTPAVF